MRKIFVGLPVSGRETCLGRLVQRVSSGGATLSINPSQGFRHRQHLEVGISKSQEKSVRVTARAYHLCLLGLLLLACQPYLDHEVLVDSQLTDFAEFGQRRQLRALGVRAYERSLLISFNQPLLWPNEDKDVPFLPETTPRLPIEKCEFEGVSQIRLTFARGIPRGIAGSVRIPAGWRALSGAALVQEQTVNWSRQGAEVLRLESLPGLEREKIRLEFDETVSFVWVMQSLFLWDETEGKPLHEAISLRSELGEPTANSSLYTVTLAGLRPENDYRLSIESALKDVQADFARAKLLELSLPGKRELEFLSDKHPPVDPDSPKFELRFSEKVAVEELRRCLKVEPSFSSLKLEPKNEFALQDTSFMVSFEGSVGPGTHRLRLAEELRAVGGASLSSALDIVPVPSIQKVERMTGARSPISVSPSETQIPFKAWPGKETRAWSVSWKQALKLASLSKLTWKGAELNSKLIAGSKESAPYWESQEAFLTEALAKGVKPGTRYFLLQRDNKQEPRRLLVRSNLSISYTDLPGAVLVRVETRQKRKSVSDATLQVTDVEGRVLVEAQVDKLGYGRLSSEQLSTHPGPLFLRALTSRDETFVALALRPAKREAFPAVHSKLEHNSLKVGEKLRCFGFGFPGRSGEALDYEIRASHSNGKAQVVLVKGTAPIGKAGEFEIQLDAPGVPGEYVIQVRDSHTDSPRFHRFTVVDGLSEGETYSLELPDDLEQAWSQERLVGKARIAGPRGRRLGLRVVSRPTEKVDQRVGWRRADEGRPNYTSESSPVKNMGLYGEFSVPLPAPWPDGGFHTLELYDLKNRNHVFDSIEMEFASRVPSLFIRGKQLGSGSSREIQLGILNVSQSQGMGISGILQWRELGSPLDSWQAIESKELQDPASERWTVDLERPGTYRILAEAEIAEGKILKGVWQRTVEGSRALPQLDPTRLNVRPGDDEYSVDLRWLAPRVGEKVWVSLFDVEEVWTRQATVGPQGGLGSFELPKTVPISGSWSFRVSTSPSLEVDGTHGFGYRIQDSSNFDLPPTTEGFRARVDLSDVDTEDVWAPKDDMTAIVDLESNDSVSGFLTLERVSESGPVRLRTIGPLRFEAATLEIPLSAPAKPGKYRLQFEGRDARGQQAVTAQEFVVESASTWNAFAPRTVRFGDRFWAGVEATARSEEPDALGITTIAVLGASILPDTYFTTSALVAPGKTGRTSFEYVVDEGNASRLNSSLKLKWQLGVEGLRHDIVCDVPYDGLAKEARALISGELARGGKRRLPLRWDDGWCLELEKSQEDLEGESVVGLVIGEEEQEEIVLPAGTKSLTYYGFEPSAIHLELLKGEGGLKFSIAKLKPRVEGIANRNYGVYLFRKLVDDEGVLLDPQKLRNGKICRVEMVLVCPEAQSKLELDLPLPGSFLPISFSADSRDILPESWTFDREGLKANFVDVPVGESRFSLWVRSESNGTYKWPVTKIWDGRKKLVAEYPEGQVRVSGAWKPDQN